MLAARIISTPDPEHTDAFLLWVESNQDNTYEKLNELFLNIR